MLSCRLQVEIVLPIEMSDKGFCACAILNDILRTAINSYFFVQFIGNSF